LRRVTGTVNLQPHLKATLPRIPESVKKHPFGGPPSAQPLSIGEIAKRSGVAASALRFYEERGLIRADRNASGYREYPRATIRRVAFIVFAQRIGLTLEAASELAALPADRAPSRADWEALSAGWTARIDARIAELQRLREGLTECIGCGCLSLDRCRLANPGDRAGARGAGPRYWSGDPRPVPANRDPTE
jgi:MerR family redox-sensitive transcriptional activator SoxR